MVETNGTVHCDRDDGAAIAGVDIGEGSMTICSKHPCKNNRNNPGGICSFCLQEKLGKLVSSSLSIAVFPSSTGSGSHSFRSESSHGGVAAVSATRRDGRGIYGFGSSQRKPGIPFLSYHRRRKEETATTSVIFKRSKSSTTTPSRKFLEGGDVDSPQKRRFWSFLYQPKHGSRSRSSANGDGGLSGSSRATPSASFSQKSKGIDAGVSSVRRGIEGEIAEDDDSPGSHVTTSTSFGRKVSRSRSVGCGSRSFSGDFLERLSSGLGDCTLRRVESQREGNKSKVAAAPPHSSCMKERVRCGGIFGGFTVVASSSGSTHWVPSSAVNSQLMHGKSRSWGWAFASPIRAFSKPSSEKGNSKSDKNTASDQSALPSLLSVSS